MEEGQGDGSEAGVCQGYVWDHQEARCLYRVGKRQREAGEITQVGQQVAVLFIYLFFYHAYMIFVVGFFLWKDTDFLFFADTSTWLTLLYVRKKAI